VDGFHASIVAARPGKVQDVRILCAGHVTRQVDTLVAQQEWRMKPNIAFGFIFKGKVMRANTSPSPTLSRDTPLRNAGGGGEGINHSAIGLDGFQSQVIASDRNFAAVILAGGELSPAAGTRAR